jgi:ABC-2 type transport system permease protein
MNTPSNVPPGSPMESRAAEPPNRPANDLMYWSIRRELWENRSITIAPLAVAAFALFVMLVTAAVGGAHRMGKLMTLDAAKRHAAVVASFSMAPTVIMITTILVGIFYSLDALYGERRDRSILFWKSLPVSDSTTVLSKAAVPLLVLPMIGFALGMATQLVFLLWSTLILIGSGMSPAPLWAELRLLEMPVTEVYGIGVFTLWHAPIYAWLLLVSCWARRTPVLWAVLPIVVINVVERVTFHTSYFGKLMAYRFMGAMTAAFNVKPPTKGHYEAVERLEQLNPLKFLGTPGLWIGLLLAAAFLAAAVRLRRYREPI